MMWRWMAAAAASVVLLAGTAALAQEPAQDQVERTAPPAWVAPVPSAGPASAVDDGGVRVVALNQQIRFDAEGTHTYTLRRIRIQNQQGLAYVSTVTAGWTPPRQTIQVHAVRILRGDEVIDVLANQSFQTLRREANLEMSMLDGRLTATLQPRDLRVGDILETAFTVHDNGGVLAPFREAVVAIGSGATVDHVHLRASWPADQPIRALATAPWDTIQPRREGGDWVYEVDNQNLRAERLPEDLPVRLALTRTAQFTDYRDWPELSMQMAPLYAAASTLEPDSPLLAEIERIRAAYPTDAERTAAALRLVQDQIRYVGLQMGEGGYVPMAADEVWRSRFGDCKGKTVLLLALLKALGVEAEAVLVSTRLGDGLDQRLPLVSWFDHVIVRATIDGRVYWMDGTRVGDRGLAELEAPGYHWALPVRAEGAQLIPIDQPPAVLPQTDVVMEFDASKGLDAEAPVVVDTAYTGDGALTMRQRFSSVTPEQLQTGLRSGSQNSNFRIETGETRYDEATNTFHLIVRGVGQMPWVDSVGGGRVLALDNTGLSAFVADKREGLLADFADDPYTISHPYMNRATVRVRLPNGGEGFTLEGGDQSVEAGGYRSERTGRIIDGVAEVSVVVRSLKNELSAAEMDRDRDRAEGLAVTAMRLRAPAGYIATDADRARLAPGEDDAEALIERAERMVGNGDTVGALALLDAAVEQSPDDIKIWRARAAARMAARDYEEARQDYDRAADIDPADVDTAVGQGLVAFSQGRFGDAVVSFTIALRLDPANVSALGGRASAYHQIGREDRALADHRALKTNDDYKVFALYGEMRTLMRLDRDAEAEALIDTALAAEATDMAALTALVELARKQGASAAALAKLDAGLAAAPGHPGILDLRARARVDAGDAAGAREDFETLRAAANGDPLMLNNVCWTQAVAGFDLDRALADCDAAARSGQANILDSRAMVLLHLERYAEARDLYDQVLTTQPDIVTSLYGRGLSRLALGDDGGREDIEKARALDIDAGEDFQVFEARHPTLNP